VAFRLTICCPRSGLAGATRPIRPSQDAEILVLRHEVANAISEPFVGTIRRELLDHTLIINQRHAAIALREYELYYNNHQPHRSLGQAAPLRPLPDRTRTRIINVRRRDRLGGLHHEYQQVA
jgi:putative transposase